MYTIINCYLILWYSSRDKNLIFLKNFLTITGIFMLLILEAASVPSPRRWIKPTIRYLPEHSTSYLIICLQAAHSLSFPLKKWWRSSVLWSLYHAPLSAFLWEAYYKLSKAKVITAIRWYLPQWWSNFFFHCLANQDLGPFFLTIHSITARSNFTSPWLVFTNTWLCKKL